MAVRGDTILRFILALTAALTIQGRACSQILKTEQMRMLFDIDPSIPFERLLPMPPKIAATGGPLFSDDLAEVPEVHLQDPLVFPPLGPDKKQTEERKKAWRGWLDGVYKDHGNHPVIQTALQIARINFVNEKKADHFLELLVENRADLAGLPFVPVEARRWSEAERGKFKDAVTHVLGGRGFVPRYKMELLEGHILTAAHMQAAPGHGTNRWRHPVTVLAGFDKTKLDRAASTKALARLAVFSQEAEVRKAARDALQWRDTSVATDILKEGLRYPWPTMAENAAEAVVQLRRTDLGPELVKMLNEPDPRAPVLREIKGKKVPVVRELVRINHLRNCLLCHPPANTPDVFRKMKELEEPRTLAGVKFFKVAIEDRADDVIIGFVPSYPIELPALRGNYFQAFQSPDIMVRADVTYLRQDFSLLQKVADADPWPEMQRFDFVVRSRVLTDAEYEKYQEDLAERQAVSRRHEAVSPYREAAQDALRRLAK